MRQLIILWLEQKGAFTQKENIKYFQDFVKLIVNTLGSLVAEYITINEPNVYATNSYYFGEWHIGRAL